MTEDQFALLQDKVALWGNASVSGSMELRDYNGRAREALAAALVERAELLAALRPFSDIDGEGDEDFPDETPVQLKFGRTTSYRPVTLGDLRAAREAIAKAEVLK